MFNRRHRDASLCSKVLKTRKVTQSVPFKLSPSPTTTRKAKKYTEGIGSPWLVSTTESQAISRRLQSKPSLSVDIWYKAKFSPFALPDYSIKDRLPLKASIKRTSSDIQVPKVASRVTFRLPCENASNIFSLPKPHRPESAYFSMNQGSQRSALC
jgi:hypothetical protein